MKLALKRGHELYISWNCAVTNEKQAHNNLYMINFRAN